MDAKDTVLTFGQHKGLPLHQVPVDYLKFLQQKDRSEGRQYIFKGVNWSQLIHQELVRRGEVTDNSVDPHLNALFNAGNQAAGTPIPVEDVDPVTELVPASKPPAEEINGKLPLIITPLAMDGAILFFIRDFITRKDQQQMLSGWTEDLAREAIRHGNKLQSFKDGNGRMNLGYAFLSRAFMFQLDKDGQGTLVAILELKSEKE